MKGWHVIVAALIVAGVLWLVWQGKSGNLAGPGSTDQPPGFTGGQPGGGPGT